MGGGLPTADLHDSDTEAAHFIPPAIEDLAALFPQLELLELIGRGGMGAVYKARQPELDRLVALKILTPRSARDPGFAERFTREARALARLNHPHIVAVYDFGHKDNLNYFVMEFVDGANLREVQKAGELSPDQALAIIPQICEALQFAHNEGVVHRDIKPENVLLDQKGRVKIADFGLAKIVGKQTQNLTLTQDGHVMGTPHYMAPEQVEHPHQVDHRADIYSLGVVFYEMLTGELPLGKFSAPSRMVQVDVRLDEVVLKTLEKRPERRYQQVSQVGAEVQTIASSGSTTVQVDASTDKTEKDKPPIVRILEIVYGNTFTSPLAIKLIKVSALGFLAFLAFLGYLPLPGMRLCFSFSGFAGFFGLIGFAFIVESRERHRRLQVQTNKSKIKHGSKNWEPHFSRTALVGALWPLFLAGAAFLALPAWVIVSAEATVPGPPWWGIALMVTVLPLGLTAPFGTTILGWVSVTQIHRSAGRLYGLWLAMLDGLLFPLLLLDAGVVWLWLLLNNEESSWWYLGWPENLFFMILTVVLSNVLIVSWVWHALTASAESPVPLGRIWIRRLGLGLLAVVIAGGLIIAYCQRPCPLNDFISEDSPDRQYSLTAHTRTAMRMLEGDELLYFVRIQGKGGAIFQVWRIPVPTEKLAQDYLVHSFSHYKLKPHGRIEWSADSRMVRLLVHGIEVFQYTAPEDATSAHASTAVATDQELEYAAMLPNGATIELLGLCKEPVEGAKWWQPDGSEMPAPSYEAEQSIPPMGGMKAQYSFLARISGGQTMAAKMNIYEGSGFSTNIARDGTVLCHVKHWDPNTTHHKDAFLKGPIEIGVAQGPWIKGRGGSGSNLESPRSYLIGNDDQIAVQPPQREKSSPDMSTQFWATASSHDYQYKIVCTLKDGAMAEVMVPTFKSTNVIKTGGLSSGKLRVRAFTIDVPIDKIAGYKLLYREFEFVRFDGVVFKPKEALESDKLDR